MVIALSNSAIVTSTCLCRVDEGLLVAAITSMPRCQSVRKTLAQLVAARPCCCSATLSGIRHGGSLHLLEEYSNGRRLPLFRSYKSDHPSLRRSEKKRAKSRNFFRRVSSRSKMQWQGCTPRCRPDG